jgi:hypothetical protein
MKYDSSVEQKSERSLLMLLVSAPAISSNYALLINKVWSIIAKNDMK